MIRKIHLLIIGGILIWFGMMGILVFLLLISHNVSAQQNGNFKTVRFVNAPTDESNILPVNGTIYYNEDSLKFRAYEDDIWKDLIGTGTVIDTTRFQYRIPRGPNEIVYYDAVLDTIRSTARIVYDSLLDNFLEGESSTIDNATNNDHAVIMGHLNDIVSPNGRVRWVNLFGQNNNATNNHSNSASLINNSFIFGGNGNNLILDDGGTNFFSSGVVGGNGNTVQVTSSSTTMTGSVILGGQNNTINDARNSILGGNNNSIPATFTNSVIAGGISITANADNTLFFQNGTMTSGTGILDISGNDLLWKTQGTTDMVNDATIDMLDNTVTLRGTNDISGFFGTLWDYGNQFFAVGDFNSGSGAGNFTYSGGTGRTLFTSPNGTGIEYFSDYEATFADRTLVTKQYVDDRTPGAVFGVDTLWLQSWDMDATAFVSRNLNELSTPITTADVISLDVIIISDTGVKSRVTTAADGGSAGTTTVDAWVAANSVNIVTVTRISAQGYDDTQYDDTSINRGFIIVTYMP